MGSYASCLYREQEPEQEDSHERRSSDEPPSQKTRRFFGCCRRRTPLPPLKCKLSESEVEAMHKAIKSTVLEAFPDGTADWVQITDVQRMLVATEGDQDLAERKLLQAVRWRSSALQDWEKIRANQTVARILGKGKGARPMIYANAGFQKSGDTPPFTICASLWDRAIYASSDPFVKLDFICDLRGFQAHLNLNVKPILSVASALDNCFAERFNSIYVVDMPLIARWIWNAIRPLLPEKTRNKLKFVNRNNPKQMETLYQLASDQEMRDMMEKVLAVAAGSTQKERGRRQSQVLIDLVDSFVLEQQRRKGS